jgi:dihydropyrimidinase
VADANLLISGGRIITSADDYAADILIRDGVIAEIGVDISAVDATVLNAKDQLVLPGGIDPHTHIDSTSGAVTTIDDFTSGTVAAAFGGTTTIVDFCRQTPGRPIREALDEYRRKLETHPPVIDVGFHVTITDFMAGAVLDELARLPELGITSFKLLMAYKGRSMLSDEAIFRTMRVAAESGCLVLIHAENGDVIDVLVKEAVAAGRREPRWHSKTRPALAEGEATGRAIVLGAMSGCPVYVVHVSCRESLEPIRRARQRQERVWAETCPQYLFVDESALEQPSFEAAKFVFTPPPRTRADQDALWMAIADDTLSVVSTDHCPYLFDGQKTLGLEDFSKIPNGAPGVETRMQLLYSFGVRTGRLSLNRFVELTSTSAAQIFGLYPRKGAIQVGSDADLVVWDPEARSVLSARTHHSKADYSLVEGYEVVGGPTTVLLRGEPIVHEGELVARPGSGRFVERARFVDPPLRRGVTECSTTVGTREAAVGR